MAYNIRDSKGRFTNADSERKRKERAAARAVHRAEIKKILDKYRTAE